MGEYPYRKPASSKAYCCLPNNEQSNTDRKVDVKKDHALGEKAGSLESEESDPSFSHQLHDRIVGGRGGQRVYSSPSAEKQRVLPFNSTKIGKG